MKKLLASRGVPKKAVLPSAIKHNLSNSSNSSEDGWCSVTTTVLPFLDMSCNNLTTLRAMNESSPVVGSSQNRIDGFVRNSPAKASLLRSPPEMPLTIPGTPIWQFSHFFRDNWKNYVRKWKYVFSFILFFFISK